MPPTAKKKRRRATISQVVALQRIDKMMVLVSENVKLALHQEAALRTANMVVKTSVRGASSEDGWRGVGPPCDIARNKS